MTGVEPLEAPRLVSLMLVLSQAAAHGQDQYNQDTAAETLEDQSQWWGVMGQELSSRLQVTTFPVSAILLLRHRVNSALECEQSQ